MVLSEHYNGALEAIHEIYKRSKKGDVPGFQKLAFILDQTSPQFLASDPDRATGLVSSM